MSESIVSAGPLIRTWDGRYAKHIVRTLAAYLDIDKWINGLVMQHWRETGEKPACHACSHCCDQWVGVWYLEALICIVEAERVGFDIDMERLKADVFELMKPDMTRLVWFGKHRPCVFKRKDGICGIYNARPSSCRALVVYGDSSNCLSATKTVSRIDTRSLIHEYNNRMIAEHQVAGIGILVSSLQVMVNLILEGGKPSDITPYEGVFGLGDERPRKRVSE